MENDFREQLRDLGVKSGDVVLMHSSMKSLKTKRRPAEFLADVISCLGTEGTLMLPAFTYGEVTEENPRFSAKNSEPCVGLLPRTFSRMEGVVRSLHPTHSVCAYGRLAKELTSGHLLDETPVGANSPIMKMLDYGGKILFIGDILDKCTFMHGVEEIAGAPYTLKKKRTSYIIEDGDGNGIAKDMFAHDFSGWGAEYQRIKGLLDYPDMRKGKVGEADCFLIDAKALMIIALEKFRVDSYYFVSDIRKYVNSLYIETKRLIITDFYENMAGSVHLCSLDEDNRRFVPDEVFETEEEALEAIRFLIRCYGTEGAPLVYAVLKKDAVHIGHVQAVPISGGWEIGYHIAEKFTGKGYATEAVRAFLPVIMEKLAISEIAGICDAENAASRAVLEKCGFKAVSAYEGGYHGQIGDMRRYRYRLNETT